ncbi:Maintenance of ploidy protein mob1 [Meristemomyces frigidus]|uniref:Maintenance of ploidy protein mob1 n=1 Tax=Meristemomyces frigidus TaxID=1508187 RepID=A0AAN7TEH2_9PEZI|nr:Maintenance of ploidy protein mob1 [Meristemomyces frigidus]
MFVHNSPPQPYSASPRPLPALHTNVLAESESCLHLPYPSSPPSAYHSPLQRHIQNVFGGSGSDTNNPFSTPPRTPAIPLPVRQEARLHEPHRPGASKAGLGFGLAQEVVSKADLLTRGNSNARNRNQPSTTASFQPQKRAKGTNSWQLKQFAEATLGSGSLRKVVQLPEGEDRDEWLAVNDFYNQINLLYGAITEFCSPTSCPEMKATDEFEYLWHDPPAFPKPTRLPAPTYISHLLTWTSAHLGNPALFPTAPGVPFPGDGSFEKMVRTIFKRLYRVYAHIYCHHYGVIRGLGLEAHLNTGFKHYVLFVEEFGLADEGGKGGRTGARNEWFGPLGELVESMLRSD